jgi:hypothetical protein
VTVVLNEPALLRFFNSTTGPVGRLMARKDDEVRDRAGRNASGDLLGIDTGDLLRGLTSRVEGRPEGVVAIIGTNATHRGFNYPAYWDQNGRPWLTDALREVGLIS